MNFGASVLKSPTQRSAAASPKPEIKAGIGSGFHMFGRENLKSPSQRSRAMSPPRSGNGNGGGGPGGENAWNFNDGFGNFAAFGGAPPTASVGAGEALKTPATRSAAGLPPPTSVGSIGIDIEPPSDGTANGTHISRAPSRQSQRSQNQNYTAASVKSPQPAPAAQLPVGISISVGADGTTTIHVVSLAIFCRFRFDSLIVFFFFFHFTRIVLWTM
jgi:hypothetical protein